MEAPDFSGWATKAGLLCSDGRTIMPGAFKHQDQVTVPLVWQHGHSNVENVLGRVVLEHQEEGVRAHAYFNNSPQAQHAKELIKHQDITQLSIWANQLAEKSKKVFHGMIREVSLVLSGANPGARIDQISISHAGGEELLEDEAIIFTGENITLEHSGVNEETETHEETHEETNPAGETTQDIVHEEENDDVLQHANEDEMTIGEVYNSMSKLQKDVVAYLVGEAVAASKSGDLKQSSMEIEDDEIREVYESMDEDQQAVLTHMVETAIEETKAHFAETNQEGNNVKHNVFEGTEPTGPTLSHDDVKSIVADATAQGSLRKAVEGYALQHGITDIDLLFPDAKSVQDRPEMFGRRTEWVSSFLGGTRKSPFTRIKTMHADLTYDDARAKGYVTGSLKKEEFFGVSKRITTPTTIYKKQKLDRDDMIDINDFDVVAWLKAEMRMMLDEEIARAALIGDGRDVAHEDKINEQNIRPIAKDHELYTSVVYVNLDDPNSNFQEVIDGIILNRSKYRGTGQPIMYTTETYIAHALLLKDTLGRRIYKNLEELAAELRVSAIVPVEVMMDEPDLVAILVNPADYVMGTDKGGNVSMFDDFDIDYNQYKYLIETRLSGALVKLKSAIVVRKVDASAALVVPEEPDFDAETGVVTVPSVTGVEYFDETNDPTFSTPLSAGAQSAIAAGSSVVITAQPEDANYYFATSDDDSWRFTRDEA